MNRRESKGKAKAAVALDYDSERMQAPLVSVAGRSAVAKEMERIARRYGIPVKVDGGLVERLEELELGEEIPSDLYRPVAAVLSQTKPKRRLLK